MKTYKLSRGLLQRIVKEVDTIPLVKIADGSGSPHFNGPSGWIHGLSNTRIPVDEYPAIAKAIAELRDEIHLGDLVQIMVNKLDAGQQLSAHRDGLPDNDRFHLPVITHSDVIWWDEQNGRSHMSAGSWHGPVPYCGVLHSVHNASGIDRVHIIADFHK